MGQNCIDFFTGQHHRDILFALRPDHPFDLAELLVQNMAEKNKRALNAWFWVEAETFFLTARNVRNSLTSTGESDSGDLLRVKA